MPSHARKHQLQGNLIYHVFNRANRKSNIFHGKDDFMRFTSILKKYASSFNLQIFHWAIMPNHYHILIELPIPEILSSIMSGIQRSYTHYYHKTYKTCGYLWQGRFKEQAIQKDRYLLACGRYIERNPVVAGIVEYAEEYFYSSARFYALSIKDRLTSQNPLYSNFGLSIEERLLNYRVFLQDFDETDDISFRNLEHPIGDKLFLRKLISLKGRYYPRRNGRPKGHV